MPKRLTIPALMLCLYGTPACAHSGSRSERGSDMSVITYDQLALNHFQNAYDAVESLRANWLRERGADSFFTPTTIQVYYDDVKLGGVETLRGITIQSVMYLRHYDGIEATARWGLDHGAGVIYVSSHVEPNR